MYFWKKFTESYLGGIIRRLFPQNLVNYCKHLPLAVLSAVIYRFPARKLKVIGITGTDGKTTTVNLTYEILRQADLPVGMISTVSAKLGTEEFTTGFHVTSPNPRLLQKILRKMVDEGLKYLVLEVTSHGLDQFRLWGIPFKIAVVTNVTPEHLDYHKTYENYLAAKAKLFDIAEVAVLNRDDRSFEYLEARVRKNKGAKIVTYGLRNKADFTSEKFKFETSLPGEYNRYNCLAAIAATSQLKVPPEIIKKAITSFKGVVGRMEEINEGQDFRVIVDFAHTPNALEEVLKFLKSVKPIKSKLIVVFGCAGLRDRQKRPKMGEIASRLADLVVLTAEDPRTEDTNDIIGQISEGCEIAGGIESKNYFKIPDRREAINFAIKKIAKKDDIVVICGKGHEKSMCFGHTEYHWSDHEAVKKVLREIINSQG